MTTIVIKTLNAEGLSREFTLVAELELGLDVLDRLIGSDEKVVTAYWVDKQQRLTVPLEVFDGKLFSVPIVKLKEEWDSILRKPNS